MCHAGQSNPEDDLQASQMLIGKYHEQLTLWKSIMARWETPLNGYLNKNSIGKIIYFHGDFPFPCQILPDFNANCSDDKQPNSLVTSVILQGKSMASSHLQQPLAQRSQLHLLFARCVGVQLQGAEHQLRLRDT